MKFATSFIAVTTILAVGAFAEPIPKEKRALADYQAILDTVSAAIDLVETDLDGYVAGTVTGTTVEADAEDLVAAINQATTDIGPLDPLSTLDALSLVSPITDLTDQVDSMVNTLIDAEDNFTTDGLHGDVLAVLNELKTAGEGLRDAVTPKVPSALQSIAENLINEVVADLQRAIDAYSD